MATNLPPINIPISVSGIDDVKKQLLSINRTVDQLEKARQNRFIQNARESSAKVNEITNKAHDKMLAEQKKSGKDILKAQKKINQQIEAEQKRHANKIKSIGGGGRNSVSGGGAAKGMAGRGIVALNIWPVAGSILNILILINYLR